MDHLLGAVYFDTDGIACYGVACLLMKQLAEIALTVAKRGTYLADTQRLIYFIINKCLYGSNKMVLAEIPDARAFLRVIKYAHNSPYTYRKITVRLVCTVILHSFALILRQDSYSFSSSVRSEGFSFIIKPRLQNGCRRGYNIC